MIQSKEILDRMAVYECNIVTTHSGRLFFCTL